MTVFEREEDDRVVFSVAIAQLDHELVPDRSLVGFPNFVALPDV